MPPKAGGKKDSGKQQSKGGKPARVPGSGKAKKKKWSKGKVRDKLANAVLFDQTTYDKLVKEVPAYKMITPSIVSERLKIRGSLARIGIRELTKLGLIKEVVNHHKQMLFARATVTAPAKENPVV